MKCPICGNETKETVCSQCGHLLEYKEVIKYSN